ncbi:signal peptidase II [Flavisphingomonas formosensis]|uniref:signal peptidase II n=1 Tax=Flavisphingomonas formosensis TaxID=861534 RepID=UPI0012F76628|nr:signal peptidase II [Sphingomonas formosensis]
MNGRTLGLATAGFVFFVDQLVKWLVVEHLQLPFRGTIELLPIFQLSWVGNHGVSMGFLTATTPLGRWLLVGLTAAIATGVLVWLWREKVRGDAFALGLVLGGALGNILDRLRFGFVVDFLDLHFGDIHPFLVFNVADAAITIGVLLLLLRALLTRQKPGPAEDLHA